MALLALVVLGMLGLSVISLRVSASDQAAMEARANARLGLMLAIGKVQRALGPDRCISARGLSLAQHPALETSVPPDSARAWWVGAASSNPEERIGYRQEPVMWLLSGLDEALSAAAQIESPRFIGREVAMYDQSSLDLTLTGGQAITAGVVPVADSSSGGVRGGYAYFVDDNGMKAQLSASHPDVVNGDHTDRRTVISGTYDLSILAGMEGMKDAPLADYLKLNSINDLPFLGTVSTQISRDKRMSFTTRSLGVLSDVRHGGLKKDLTIAFEKHTTSNVSKFGYSYSEMPSYSAFDLAFAKTSDDEWGDYLLLHESKRGEFAEQGYIHWGMLRDYDNLKRYISRIDGRDTLAPMVLDHGELGHASSAPYSRGILPPHEFSLDEHPMGKNMNWDTHRGMPYGDFDVSPRLANSSNIHEWNREYYKHSPLSTLVGQMQFNVWLERTPASNPANPNVSEALVFCNQLFVSHYNPYNMNLEFNQRGKSFAFRGLPGVKVRIPGGQIAGLGKFYGHDAQGWRTSDNATPPGVTRRDINVSTLSHSTNGREYKVGTTEHVGPGRAMFCGFQETATTSDASRNDSEVYGTTIRDLVTERAYKEYEIEGPLPPQLEWDVTFAGGDSGLPGMWGKASQILWGFWNNGEGSRGELKFENLQPSTYNENTMLRHSIRLRTTKEPGNSLRPLVDSNIRAFYTNPRWDNRLLDGIANYILVGSEDQSGAGEIMDQVPMMSPQSDGKGYGYWGAEHEAFLGNDRVILFDVPRQDLVSLGQLQHANMGRFSYEPSYIIGNSYANPRIPLDNWKDVLVDDTLGMRWNIERPFTLYDTSYLANEALWDGHIFTTIPQVADNYDDTDEEEPSEELFADLLRRDELLPNPRFIPYEPQGSSFDMETLQADEAVHYNAGHVLVDGAFNVNSTSVDAWEAFLSGTHGMPYQRIDGNGNIVGFEAMEDGKVRFPRVQSVYGEEMTTDSPDENYWVGFRALEQEEVREFAEAIVEEIKARGPFLSMAEFVNRKLENGEHGHMGALQAALDKTVNQDPLLDYDQAATHSALPPGSNQAAAFPGQLLQGDILQALSPCMSVRSDTFTIRAYGESINPKTGEVLARAWCEATVQRYPDPTPEIGSDTFLDELVDPSSPFGRRFDIISFRWLNSGDV